MNKPFNTDAYFNTVGGGPLFVDNGIRIGGTNSPKPCDPAQGGEPFVGQDYCTSRRQWTAVGMTSDGRYLIVVVTNVDQRFNMDDAARLLIAEGATKAMKLDGGGSSQAWYRPLGSVAPSLEGRPISNAIMVFSTQ